jgi:hypothetical protein
LHLHTILIPPSFHTLQYVWHPFCICIHFLNPASFHTQQCVWHPLCICIRFLIHPVSTLSNMSEIPFASAYSF